MKTINEKQRVTPQHNEITDKIGRKQFQEETINHTSPFQICLIAFQGFIKRNENQP